MEALGRYESVRPQGSAAAPRWFNLGDQDLATHFYRTARLDEGASLTEVSDEIRRAWQVPISLVPMSNQPLATFVTILNDPALNNPKSGEEPAPHEVSFQDYFVRLHHDVPVKAVRFEGNAELSQTARTSLTEAETVVIAPSNPLVSIGPIRSLPGVDELLASRRDSVVAVSPIVGGAALKGPADRMMTDLGYEASAVGVAKLYAPIASALVIDPVDEHLAPQIEAAGMRCVVTPSIMSTPSIARSLALATLSAVRPS
jgi:LPPG:FO 2-phospho-L-lactate transferase